VCWGLLRWKKADASSARQENMEQGRVRAQAALQQRFQRQRARRALRHVCSVMGMPIRPVQVVLLLPASAIRATLETTAPAVFPALRAHTRHRRVLIAALYAWRARQALQLLQSPRQSAANVVQANIAVKARRVVANAARARILQVWVRSRVWRAKQESGKDRRRVLSVWNVARAPGVIA